MPHQDSYYQFAAVREVQLRGLVLHIFGDVDITTAGELEHAIDEGLVGGETLLVDFSRCRYLDSSGLSVLVRVGKRVGSRLTIGVKPGSNILRTMRVVGFDKLFNVITELDTSNVPRTSARQSGHGNRRVDAAAALPMIR